MNQPPTREVTSLRRALAIALKRLTDMLHTRVSGSSGCTRLGSNHQSPAACRVLCMTTWCIAVQQKRQTMPC